MEANLAAKLKLIPDYHQKWRSQIFSHSAMTRSSLELAVNTIYQAMGLPAPKIEFFDGPLAASQRFNLDYWGNKLVQIDQPIAESLQQELGLGLWKQLRTEVYEPLHDRLWSEIGSKLFACLESSYTIWHDLSLSSGGKQQYFNPVMDFMTSEYSLARACWFDFAYEVLNCQSVPELWQSYRTLITNCGWLLTYCDICIVCARPLELRVDEQLRLHGEGEPAVLFADGFCVYAYQGVVLPEKYSQIHPSAWKINWILEERNAELRRILIHGIGYDRLCQASFSEELDSWQEYTLLKIDLNDDREPAYLIKMTCPSTGNIHALRVPPTISSAREAIRWTNWDIDPGEFSIQT